MLQLRLMCSLVAIRIFIIILMMT